MLPSLYEWDNKGEKHEYFSLILEGPGEPAFVGMTDHCSAFRACDAHITTGRGAGVWTLLSRIANVVNWRNLAL